ncbi:hypothetical protein [Gemmatimonas groenlandica]|uniref:Uncharacterized protein n=1 Tax=Gemmatimonas groenlandica TaxID=2732249 RepID=A0A6M4IX09_9BACT|nr:hypothetical protein [Gemmatimonas groenlandica]QJR36721.1 hypothetical protein HKW67_14970 [Gemmatimonas groenlandica]
METLGGFPFLALEYDQNGVLRSSTLDTLHAHLQSAGTTDLLMIAHGFRNNAVEARRLYEQFLQNFSAHITRSELAPALASRRFAAAGIFWPSKAFSEGSAKDDDDGEAQALEEREAAALDDARIELMELRDDVADNQRSAVDRALALLDHLEDSTAKQDQFVSLLLSLADGADADPTEGFEQVAAQRGSELFAKLKSPIILPTVRRDDDGGVMALNGGASAGSGGGTGAPLFIGGALKSIAGRVGQVLNLTTWYMMKNRSGTVGANGVAAAVRALKARHPALRIHLIGHSLGGRCMAACAKSLCADPAVQPDSLSLLEAAFSHYGLSHDNGHGDRGFFRDVIEHQIVKGPFISTFSYQDAVVGKAYAISSRLGGDNAKAVGDKDDQYGGIGRNGTQRTNEATTQPLGSVGTAYTYAPRVVNNLDGSGGRIKDHSDVTNPEVTYAVACAVAAT